MRLKFENMWKGNSLKAGGVFPINIIEIYFDINPGYKYFHLVILNFVFSVDFMKRGKK